MAMTPAEKQRAYRERQAAQKVAEELFAGETVLTIEQFLDGVEFDEQIFLEALDGIGEESLEHEEEEARVWQEAYDEAFEEAYNEELQAAIADGFDPDTDDDADLREAADDEAKEAAKDAVAEWLADLDDYDTTRVVYPLTDLLAAYREAHGLG
jgi:hypothetical protein